MANSFHRIRKGISLTPTVLPVSGEVGDILCDIADNEIKRWDGLSWVKVGSGGGVIVVADITERNNIPEDERTDCMLVGVVDNDTIYKLTGLPSGATTTDADWDAVITSKAAQVITAKDIDGGTASNTSRSTIPRAATIEAAAALVRKKATLLYNDFTNKFLKDNGTDLKSIPDFGDVNIFAQEIAEDNVIGSWTQNLSGITATFAKGTDSRLGTCYKLDITSAASGADGTYTVRKDFAVPERVRGTFVELSYDYVSTVSKTGTCVILYDATNSVTIIPQTDIQAQPDPTSLVTKGFITFSIPSNCETLRVFIGRAVDASAIAISNQYFYFNNLQLKKTFQNTAITEGPKSHIRFGNGGNRGSTNTQVVYFTELAEQSGTGLTYVSTSALGTEIRVLRSGVLTVTSTRNQPVGAVGAQIVKNATTFSTSHPTGTVIGGYSGSSGAGVQVQMSGSTRVVAGDIIRLVAENNTSAANVSNTFSAVLHEDNLAARFADYTLNQDVLFQGYVSTGQALTANVTNIVLTTNKDTTGSWDGDEFIVPSDGDYIISGFLSTNNNGYKKIDLYVDGVFVAAVGENSGFSTVQINSGVLSFQRGKRLSFRSSLSLSTTNASGYYFTIQKVATSQQLFAPIAQRYVVKTYQSGTSWYEVYNDGWVRQGSTITDADANGTFVRTYLINFKDTNYTLMVSTNPSQNISSSSDRGYVSARTTTNFTFVAGGQWNDPTVRVRSHIVEGYGDSAAVKALGSNPNY